MNFLIISQSLGFGGAERNIIELVKENSNYYFTIIILSDDLKFDVPENVLLVNLGHLNFFSQVLNIIKLFKSNNYSFLLCFLTRPIIIGLLIKYFCGVKLIINERSNPELIYKYNKILDFCYKFIVSKFYSYADFITVNSIGALNFYRKYIPSAKLKYVKNYNSQENLFERPLKRKLVSVGRLDDNKNIDFIIEAFSQEKSGLFTLDIYGDGPNKEILFQKIIKYDLIDKVNIKGNISDVVGKLHEYDIFLFASKVEGCPNVLNEANSIGLPIVSLYFENGVQEIFKYYIEFISQKNCAVYSNGIVVYSFNFEDYNFGIKYIYENLPKFHIIRSEERFLLSYYEEKISSRKISSLSNYSNFLSNLR